MPLHGDEDSMRERLDSSLIYEISKFSIHRRDADLNLSSEFAGILNLSPTSIKSLLIGGLEPKVRAV